MMGRAAVQALMDRESGKMTGIVNGESALIPLDQVTGKLKPIDQQLLELYRMLDV
jgi:hypothetical protein